LNYSYFLAFSSAAKNRWAYLHTVEVASSNLASPTKNIKDLAVSAKSFFIADFDLTPIRDRMSSGGRKARRKGDCRLEKLPLADDDCVKITLAGLAGQSRRT